MTIAIVMQADSRRGDADAANAEVPVWFGDASRTQRMAGHVFGATPSTIVHVIPEIPDLAMAHEQLVVASSSGDFDLGELRAGRYIVFATGDNALSRVAHVDTLQRSSAGSASTLELYLHDVSRVEPHVRWPDGELVPEWELSYRTFTAGSFEHAAAAVMRKRVDDILRDRDVYWRPPATAFGFVRHSDGSPARGVGVQPVECASTSEAPDAPLPSLVTTSAVGAFELSSRSQGYRLCGLRVWNGPQIYDLAYRERPPTLPLQVKLPPVGSEPSGVFESYRVSVDDPRGRWIRGRVVRAGQPVGDVGVTAVVAWSMGTRLAGETRSRSDGTFAVFVSIVDEDPFADKHDEIRVGLRDEILGIGNGVSVRIPPGSSLDNVTYEVGAPVPVSGVVVGERGEPLPGLRLTCGPAIPSAPTNREGHVHFQLYRQGRCQLKVLGDTTAQLLSPHEIDVAHLDTKIDDLRVVVFIPPEHETPR